MLDQATTHPLSFLFWLAALAVAITVHEFAHAWSADRLGDPTPRLMGRLTLNPLAHLDPLGTIMLLIARFGWGKPVVFDPFNLRHPRRDSAIISLAGPSSNLFVATLCSLILRVLSSPLFPLVPFISYLVANFLVTLITLNVILAVFNLLPVHPLDGFKIVGGFLPREYARQWYELEPYGLIFLILLVFPIFGGPSPVSQLISPVINLLLSILLPSPTFI